VTYQSVHIVLLQ
jgi:methionine synthase II (cobalamin-independent)